MGLRDKAPFRPFDVHLADGRSIRVHHPDLLSPSPTGRELVIWSADGSFNLVDANQVTSVALRKRSQGVPRAANDPFLTIGRRTLPSPKGATKHEDIDRIQYGRR